jgi:hypothetical protein
MPSGERSLLLLAEADKGTRRDGFLNILRRTQAEKPRGCWKVTDNFCPMTDSFSPWTAKKGLHFWPFTDKLLSVN